MSQPNLYARVRTFLCTLHARPRVRRAPGLPCALAIERGRNEMENSGKSCREIAESHIQCRRPRMRAIQYAAAHRFKHSCLWNTGSPAFAGDDTECDADEG